MYFKLSKVFTTCILIFIFCSSAFAQGGLKGTVTDSLTTEPLFGANVYVMGTGFGAATDFEGVYRISGIPAGNYTLIISYVGYSPKKESITIENNKTLQLDVELNLDVVLSETVVITAQAKGQVAAINQQLTSNTIVSVVSEEKIQELPDANAAEAIGRLPGVSLTRSGGEANRVVLRGLSDRFSSITVDGVRIASTDADTRGVDLSTISQGSLAGIELFKALTSDMDADAIAGSVNLVTRKAPRERLIRLDAKGAYNNLTENFGQYDFAVRYGERFLENKLGIQLSVNIEQRDRSRENFRYGWNTNTWLNERNERDYRLNYFDVVFTDEIRKRNGISLLLDYDTPDGGSIKFNNIYNITSRDFIEYARQYRTDGNSDLPVYSARDREQEISSFNSSLTGENFILGFEIDWGLSIAESKAGYPYDYYIDFQEPSSSDPNTGEQISGMRNIPLSLLHGPVDALAEYAFNNFDIGFMYSAYYRKEDNLEKDRSININIQKEYSFSNKITGIFKFGGKYKYKQRYRSRSEVYAPYYLTGTREFQKLDDGTIIRKPFYDEFYRTGSLLWTRNFIADPSSNFADERMVDKKFRLYPMLDRDYLRWFWKNNKNGSTQNGMAPEYYANTETDALYYDVTERISAYYLMNNLSFSQTINFIAGLRVESEDNFYKSKYSKGTLSGFPELVGVLRDTTAAHTETVWLPNFQLVIKPTEWMSVRLAAYKALARPDFNYRLENFVARYQSTFFGNSGITLGNPNLKAAVAWNYEINTSFYSNSIGLFTISAFYKDVDNMYQLINAVNFEKGSPIWDKLGIKYTNPIDGPYDLTYPYNSDKPTKVWGFEIEHQANLLMLPGFLKNLIVSYNFSIVRSETYVPTSFFRYDTVAIPRPPFKRVDRTTVLEEQKQKLSGQPEFFGNVSIGYDYKGFSGRVSLFYQGRQNNTFSDDGQSDGVIDEYFRVDLALKQVINDYMSIMLNINNLTNINDQRSTLNRILNWDLLRASESYGLTGDLGIRINL